MSTATRSAGAERFAARARRRRFRGAVRVVIALLLAVAAGGLAWLVGWSSVLSVNDVAVHGVGDDLRSDVTDIAEVPIGVPLIRVDTDGVADRVRELPDVGEVSVRRSWPNTLTIDIAAREASAAVRDGRSWWSVDETGVLFGRADTPPDGVPVLVTPTDESARLARVTGVAVVTSLPSSIDQLVESVEAESPAGVRLILTDGTTVVWGTADRAQDKTRALLALMEAHDEDPPSVYDVSAPDTPAVS
ncbi:FtsQ-type POTRA domain-containing protein [Phytoactinopolyspora alkaliphila]|uniref:FtsQ-type POTRA domain-containing protein n=1 Tax=Phytoactinopolyspora alkaliphila TaxID=1783498 RepID=A0A6N9YFS6_9ACTN|nr:FtsQ-type POTRA domain-containing protein [Phytoactinopolyspora alkaliphila]NED93822.1 FtsQ-type POTRA domain-containing protein [Phytoactinopolyspora alkaliphila]